jgi:hypothetical protein
MSGETCRGVLLGVDNTPARGLRVRVWAREQIEKSLDANGALKGCAIVEPMYAYCGQLVTRRR